MKIPLLVAIACLCAGCSSVPLSQDIPDYSGAKAVADQDRGAYYDSMRVAETRGNIARIGESWYDVHALKKVYAETGDAQARHMAGAAMARNIALDVAPPVTLGLGVFIGAYAGLIVFAASEKQSTTSNGSSTVTTTTDAGEPAYIYQGAVVGLIFGAVAAGIEYWLLNDSMQAKLAKSADIFNQHLRETLHFEVNPEPSGAKAGVSKSF